MSLFSLNKFFRPNVTRRDFDFLSNMGWSKREECWWDGAGELPLRLVCRTSWIDIQQSRESPGNLWASKPPLADTGFASSVWGGWLSFAPHLFPIKSYKTPIKTVTKQKFSQVQLGWNFLYQFCHLQRLPHNTGKKKCGLIHPGGPGNAFSQLLLWNELLSFRVTLPWNNPTCRQGGEVPRALLMISCSPLLQHWKWKPWNACESSFSHYQTNFSLSV